MWCLWSSPRKKGTLMTRPVLSVSSDTTITSSLSGYDIYATGGQRTITLTSASSVTSDVRVINGDSSNAKILASFPSDVNVKLYPKQAVAVNSDGTNWFATEKPGRWKIPGGTILYVHSASSLGNDANDGLTPQTPIQHMRTAGPLIQTDFDTNQTAPIVAPMAGSDFLNDTFAVSGQPTGGNLIQLSPYGTGTITWTCSGPCITIGDNGELDMRWNGLSTSVDVYLYGNSINATANGSIYQHNNGLFDMEGTCTIIGSGTNTSAFFFDGPCPGAAIQDGFNLRNTFGDVFRMDEGGGRFTVSGLIQPTSATIVGRMFAILGTNELILGGPQPTGSSAYLSIGPSIVAGNAVVVTNGVNVPGGWVEQQGGVRSVGKTS